MPSRIDIFLLLLAAASTAAAQSYTVEEGFDRPGSDYESFEQDHSSPDPDNCRAACASQPKCKSYTYVRPGAAGPHAWCRLKNATPAPIEDACCVSGVKGGQPRDRALPSFTLEWLGWDADRVGKAPDVQTPDGAPDHHLRLTVKVAPAAAIRAIELKQADWQGVPHPDGLVWSTQVGDAQPLALESAGTRWNAAALAADTTALAAPGTALDLYAHDIGQWQAGNSVVAAIVLADGRRIAHAFLPAPPPDRLIGLWQMHCDGGPEAFEPVTLSGLFQLVRHPDDTVTGYFGATPIRGKVGAGGAVEGVAEGATLRAVWRGKLEQATRGKPLRGSGGFVLERAPSGACTGEGAWSNR